MRSRVHYSVNKNNGLFLYILLMVSQHKALVDLTVTVWWAQSQWMAAAIANIMVAHNNVAVTKRHTSTHNPSAVPLLRLRTAQPVSAFISQVSCSSYELCITACTTHVSLEHRLIALQHVLINQTGLFNLILTLNFPRARGDPHIPVWWTLFWWLARRSMSISHHHDPRSDWWNPTTSTSPIGTVQRR